MRKLDEKMDSLVLLSSSSRYEQRQISHDLSIFRNASSLETAESSQSLASIASSLSRLEALMPPAQMTSPWEATEEESQNKGANDSNSISVIPQSELFIPSSDSPAWRGTALVEMTDSSTQTVDEASGKGLEMIEFQETLDRSNLLRHWSGTRDRINRWLLHSLICDKSHAELHKSQMPPGLDEPTWLRLVLRYWFIDEAATGVEIACSLSGGAIDGRTGSSLVSSESSEYQTCVEEFEIGDAIIRDRITLFSPLHPLETPQSMMGQFNSKVSSSTQKKHKCKVCDKRFTRPSSLQIHMYSHTGEKPYACGLEGCESFLAVVSNLRRHR